MTVEFRLPDLGEGIHEAEVLTWKVQPGDRVEAFQPVVEVESAKAAVELTSPASGVVAVIAVPAGATAHLGDLLFVIEPDPASSPPPGGSTPAASPSATAGQAPAAASAASADSRSAAHGPPASAAASPFEVVGAAPSTAAPSQSTGSAEDEQEFLGIVGSLPRASSAARAPAVERARVLAAPFVRKLARERGIELEDVPGTGPQGRVRLADLDAFWGPPAAPDSDDVDVVPFAGLRKRIADHLVEAVRLAPQVTAMDLFDVTELVEARAALRPVAEAEGIRLTYLPFLIKACLIALRAVPDANGVVDEANQALVRHRGCHIGIATTVPGGLVVPVLRHAEQRS
ncbi:MAG: 2-oxo acid dehydrogenase subunit E2, partial [Chloroflexi bacterium]|nr:2-oxo acid dehydrogenase subunit E2 [Chloroflexota bacterium]